MTIHAAADRAAVRRQDRERDPGRLHGQAGHRRATSSSRPTGRRSSPAKLRRSLAGDPARRAGAEHAAAADGVAVAGGAVQAAAGQIAAGLAEARAQKDRVTLLFRPDPTIRDGRYANNGWLQELPKPLTKLTWDNALVLGPATAERLGLNGRGDGRADGRRPQDRAPRSGSFPARRRTRRALSLGYGRTPRAARRHRLRLQRLRPAHLERACGRAPVEIRGSASATSSPARRTTTRSIRRATRTTLGRCRGGAPRGHPHRSPSPSSPEDPQVIQEEREKPAERRDPVSRPTTTEGHAWGMAIDLNVCIGCNACVVACQAENNIPVVGKDQVLAAARCTGCASTATSRADIDDPQIHYQPVPCMHCENAPCELVCPVEATSHSAEGLNDMVYNRCVGTRYCSNNCPYKVRRFNFLQLQRPRRRRRSSMLHNPDVTVRRRGVMEKCTYCVQRINAGARSTPRSTSRADRADGRGSSDRLPAGLPDRRRSSSATSTTRQPGGRAAARPIRSTTGCSRSSNTRPRTTYLAKLRNPNPRARRAAPRARPTEPTTWPS